MNPEILKMEIRRTRTGLFIWCVIAACITLLGILEYPVIGQNVAQVEEALLLIPKFGRIVFGVYGPPLDGPLGYFTVMSYWSGLVVYAHAMYSGASVVAKETRDKTSEYLFTMPCRRGEIIWSKIIASLFNIFVMGIVNTAANIVSLPMMTNDPAVYISVLTACIGIFFAQIVLTALGLLCSALFKTYRAGVTAAFSVLTAGYALMFVIQYSDSPSLNFLSPLAYFGAWDVVISGINPAYIPLAGVIVALCLIGTLKLYGGREMG